jgi:PAS domain S-box-containing protein
MATSLARHCVSADLDMLERVGVAVAVLDVTAVRAHGDVRALRVAHANARCLALYGARTLAELQAHLAPALAEAAAGATGLVDGLRGSERAVEVDAAVRAVSGQRLQLALVLSPVAASGDRTTVVVTALDRAPVAQQLQESEQRFRIMADFAPVLLWMSGTDGLCYFFNKVWLEFTGRTMEEERGNGWAEGVYAEDFQRCMTTYLDAFVAREPFRMEYRLRRADGAYRWVLDTGTPRITPDGAFAGYIGSCIDITEIKALHAELDARVQSRTAELTAAVAELEAFCYSVSHDLRAPLRGIDGFSQAVLEDNTDKLDARSHDHLQRVRAAAQRMGRLIDDLLKLSRFSRGELRVQQVDLTALARAIVNELADLEPERRVRVAIEDGLTVDGDPTLLRAVLENLLGNAWKFTRKTPEPAIALGIEAGPGRVFFVRDNGVGFSMDHAGALFAPFQRLHAERDFPGTGIGLASAQRIIQRHGGRIWVDAAEGAGACFRWTLPRARGPA